MISLSSLPRICVPLGVADVSKLERLAVAACDDGEDFLELRLDMLDEPEAGIRVFQRIARRYPNVVLLATCRRKQNGGEFRGSVEAEIAILEEAARAGAGIVDVEIETAEEAPALLKGFEGNVRLLISYHNFERTPALSRVMGRLRKIPADLYKVAVFARKPSDALRTLELAASDLDRPIVSLAMGDVGVTTRILGPSRGAAFVFGSLAPRPAGKSKRLTAEPTAPGQISADSLRNLYSAHHRTPATRVFGVVADPVRHSMSPVLHNRAFKARRVDAVYLPFLVHPNCFADFWKVVQDLPIEGLSVTIPHKQRVMRHLDSIEPLAKRIGAVNTVFRKKQKLCGTNTDAQGIVAPLAGKMRLAKKSALIVGNGGAARAAIFALRDQGVNVTLTGRNPSRVRRLARDCRVDAVDRGSLADRYYDIVVQSTPLGMFPAVDGSFFEDRIPADVVFEMIYNPLETKLLRMARQAGKTTISGLEMFLEQAAAQFEIWTGESAPRGSMRTSVLDRLTQSHAA